MLKMQTEEEILGRCAICDYIGHISDVERHVEMHDTVESENENNYNENSEMSEARNNVVQYNEFSNSLVQLTPEDNKLYWNKNDVILLIDLYKLNKHKFDDRKTTNKSIWKNISQEIQKVSNKYISAEHCENKFKNLKKTYKKIVDNNSASGRGSVIWPYFNKMADIFNEHPEVSPLSICSSLEGSSRGTVKENSIKNDISKYPSSKKRNANNQEEPEYFKKFRAECQKRHEEKMQRQDKFLAILEQLIEK